MKEITLISENLVKIENVIISYLDLLYKGDIDLIESVFLQEATDIIKNRASVMKNTEAVLAI